MTSSSRYSGKICSRLPLRLAAWLFVLVTGGSALATENPARIDDFDGAERLLRFATELLQAGEHYRAITEFMRFQSYFPADRRAPVIPVHIALAYLRGGRPDEALRALSPAFQSDDEELSGAARYLAARAYYDAGQFELALEALERTDHRFAELAAQQRLFCLLRLGQREIAVALLASDGFPGYPAPVAEILSARINGAPPLRRKSPVVASILSAILPGGGQYYAGRRRDAAVSLIVNGLFVLGAVQSYRKDNLAAGILLTTVGAGWYTGNIVAAANGARHFNESQQELFLRENVDLPSLERERQRVESDLLLGLKVRF